VTGAATIALTDLPRKLREITGGTATVPSYRIIYGRVLDGAISAERRNGRWYVTDAVVREIASSLSAGAGDSGRTDGRRRS